MAKKYDYDQDLEIVDATYGEDKVLDGMSEAEIKKWAAMYDPDEEPYNCFGSTKEDIAKGDLMGANARKREAAYEWVKEHCKRSPREVISKARKSADEINEINEKLQKPTTFGAAIGYASKIKNLIDEVKSMVSEVDKSDCDKDEREDIESLISTINEIEKIDISNFQPNKLKIAKPKIKIDDEVKEPKFIPANGVKVDTDFIKNLNNDIQKISDKVAAVNFNSTKEDALQIKKECEQVIENIRSIDLMSCSVDNLNVIGKAKSVVDLLLTKLTNVETVLNTVNKPQQQQQQAAAANDLGFNISNFVGNNPMIRSAKRANQQRPQSVFPHMICGLTDEQIVAEVVKHVKVLYDLPAYQLYDLISNKVLAKKLKELNAKNPDNFVLYQKNIREYIDIPELLSKYNLCFTVPCNDKGKVIIVLFNMTPVEGNNGALNYPLHIFKASYVNNNNNQ